MLSPFISPSECDPLGWECRAKKAADVAVAAAKDAIAQAAAEEEPEGDEEEMIDVAAATDAPSMEEVSPSGWHHSSILQIHHHPRPQPLHSLLSATAMQCAGGGTGCSS